MRDDIDIIVPKRILDVLLKDLKNSSYPTVIFREDMDSMRDEVYNTFRGSIHNTIHVIEGLLEGVIK